MTRPRPRRWSPPPLSAPRTVTVSYRMADVLHGICCGWTNDRIARHLGVTVNSVKTHRKRLFAALGAADKGHAAALACSGQVRVLVTARPNDDRRAA